MAFYYVFRGRKTIKGYSNAQRAGDLCWFTGEPTEGHESERQVLIQGAAALIVGGPAITLKRALSALCPLLAILGVIRIKEARGRVLLQ